MARFCNRPGCPDAAVATLSYDYHNRTAWLDHLADEDHPMTHDLCQRHADLLVVPNGWHLENRWIEGTLTDPQLYRDAIAS